jgi:hypothetical protein
VRKQSSREYNTASLATSTTGNLVRSAFAELQAFLDLSELLPKYYLFAFT